MFVASSCVVALGSGIDHNTHLSLLINTISIVTIMHHLVDRIQQQQDEEKKILAAPMPPPQEEKEPNANCAIFNKMMQDQILEKCTNFTRSELLDLFHRMQPHFQAHRRRGPAPVTPPLDSLICILCMYKTGLDFDRLASMLAMKATTLRDVIDRVRPILYATLTEAWWNRRQRPAPLLDTNYLHITLLVDATSLQVFRPRGRFEEAQIYYDTKNGIYALKKEVAVMAKEPHYALFSSKAFIGADHDYKHFKNNYSMYLEYLKKDLEEKRLIDDPYAFWSICADKGYIGPASDTPEIRRIVPKKAPRTTAEKKENEEISKIRVKVECFFGRMTSKWVITRHVYRLDHSRFDMDLDNCILLTNEIIKKQSLVEQDREFLLKSIQARTQQQEEARNKRRASYEKYKLEKKRRLQLVDANQ